MDASLQNKIAPPVAPKTKEFNQLKIKSANDLVVPEANKVDFKKLLMDSQQEIRNKRQAEANGDLSKSKNYEDFLDSLNKKSRNEGMPKNTLGKEDFLTLFITQLQHQDPLNPKDGAEMASQLAQFNGLEQMINMNGSLGRLEKSTSQGHDIQFIDYIGKEVSVNDGRVALSKGEASKVNYKINNAITRASLQIRNDSGDVVASKELGAKQAGNYQVNWNGLDNDGAKLPDGIYTFTLNGKGKGGSSLEVPLTTRLRITGIDLQNEGSTFYTDIGKISYQDIAEIGEQDFKDPTAIIRNQLNMDQSVLEKKTTKAEGVEADKANPKLSVEKAVIDSQNVENNKKQEAFYPEIKSPFSGLEAYRKTAENKDSKAEIEPEINGKET